MRQWAPGELTLAVIGGLLATAVLTAFFALASFTDPDTWVPVLVAVVLVLITTPIIFALSRGDRNRRLRWLLVIALLLKLGATIPRYYVNEVTYQGSADAGRYHQAGRVFVENREKGEWSIEGAYLTSFSSETRAIGYIAGIVYSVIGPSLMGGFLVFSWFAFLGLLFFFQAFRMAFPNAPPLVPAALLFLLPSMLYWPSSLGKDSVMVGCLGAITWGLTCLFMGRRRIIGVATLLAGAWLVATVRPHLLMVVLVGLAGGLLARSASNQRTRAAVGSRVILLLLLVPLVVFGMSRMDRFFGTTGEDRGDAITATLEKTDQQTSVGNSSFETRPVRNPLQLPLAAVNVFYRPFLFEASGPSLVSALEGTVLLGLTVWSGRWLWRIGPAVHRSQFAAFCAGYVLAFVFAFSNIGNAGILARQRVQLFPFVILMAMAAREHHRVHLQSAGTTGTESSPQVPSRKVSSVLS